MFTEKTVKMLTELPLAIINSVDSEDGNLVQPGYLLKLSKDGNLEKIKNLVESNIVYKTTKYLEATDEVINNFININLI